MLNCGFSLRTEGDWHKAGESRDEIVINDQIIIAHLIVAAMYTFGTACLKV